MTQELEDRLRAMLRERVGDVTHVPERVFAFEQIDARTRPERSGPNRRPLLLAVAAAVVAVLALAGIVVALQGGDNRRSAPPAGSTTAPAPSTVAPRPTPVQVTRTAALSWVGLGSLPGFTTDYRVSSPDFRQIGLVREAEGPRRTNGGASFTDLVTVYRPGRFAASRVTGWRSKAANGTTVRFGTLPVAGDDSGRPAASLAFRSPSGSWVLVQGLTATAGRDAVLITIAAAVRPDQNVQQRVPFRLNYVPPGFGVDRMEMGAKGGSSVEISLTSRKTELKITSAASINPDHRGEVQRTVGGRTAWVSDEYGTVQLPGLGVIIEFSSFSGTPTAAQLRPQLDKILAGVEWATAVDAMPTAEQAIP